MVLLRTSGNRKFSARRKVLLGVIVMLLLAIVYGWYSGAVITRGIPVRDMDWNGNGTVDRKEIAQAFYGVIVREIVDDGRQCKEFRWRRTGEIIRRDCRRVFSEQTSS